MSEPRTEWRPRKRSRETHAQGLPIAMKGSSGQKGAHTGGTRKTCADNQSSVVSTLPHDKHRRYAGEHHRLPEGLNAKLRNN